MWFFLIYFFLKKFIRDVCFPDCLFVGDTIFFFPFWKKNVNKSYYLVQSDSIQMPLIQILHYNHLPKEHTFIYIYIKVCGGGGSLLKDNLCISAASRNFEKGARSRRHFQKVGQPEYFWTTHPFNAKHPFNMYLCITILQEAFISIITNFLFLKNTFKIQKNYYNRFLPFLLSRKKKS